MSNPLPASPFAGGGAYGSPEQVRIGETLATHATDSELPPSPDKGRAGVGLKQQPN
jgi:hypothetical protein